MYISSKKMQSRLQLEHLNNFFLKAVNSYQIEIV